MAKNEKTETVTETGKKFKSEFISAGATMRGHTYKGFEFLLNTGKVTQKAINEIIAHTGEQPYGKE